ncbi:hypothetical protein Gogos_021365 [Gossypium gossypioides]|uniref:DUF4283 domain-containing protein n=1 Tax=Gossypium gossypioides TaxID=34282 RepID=A0A7J9D1W1_GOSGO|nr:hypothetical protein [Gossypium gossypioides]
METELALLSLNEEEEEIPQIQTNPSMQKEVGDFQLVGCFQTASIIHFPAMKSTMANLWHPVYGVQIRDLGEKRALSMNNIWLRKEGEGKWEENWMENKSRGFNQKNGDLKGNKGKTIDPILGLSLEGRVSSGEQQKNKL